MNGDRPTSYRTNRHRILAVQAALVSGIAIFTIFVVLALAVTTFVLRVAALALAIVLPILTILTQMDPPSRISVNERELSLVRKGIVGERIQRIALDQVRDVHVTRGLGKHVHVKLETASGEFVVVGMIDRDLAEWIVAARRKR